jgi:diguanylate cyclase (GGDEF)-like protein/PAS domain S-box-containing protein
MPRKPTYGELLHRISALKKELRQYQLAYETMRQSEERYRQLITTAPLGLLVIDRQGRILEINPKTLEILGSPSEAATLSINVLQFPLLVQSGISDDIRRCLETGEAMVADHPYLSKWGKPAHLRYHLTPIIGANGAVSGVQAICEDFTKLKQAEEALQKHKERLEEVVHARTAELTEANTRLTSTIEKLESRTNAILFLNELSQLLQACNSEKETYAAVVTACQRLFPADSGFLSILDTGYRLLKVVTTWGSGASAGQEFDLEDCWAIRRGKVHCVVKPESDLICPHLRHASDPDLACLCAPLSAHGEVLGVLHLCLGQEGRGISEADKMRVLESKKMLVVGIVERYAPSLTSLRLRETLRIQSIRDPLTGLYNRRYMEGSLLREERRAKRHGTQLGIIVIDVDHFKTFNDAHGHDGGDMLLRALGAFLSEHTRGEDIACRHGGEEFTLILPEASLANTRQRAEELRKGVSEKLRIRHRRKVCKITISLGVAVFPEHGLSAKEALQSADMALYRAKAEGRNRVAVAFEMPKDSEPRSKNASRAVPSAIDLLAESPNWGKDSHVK